MEREAVNRVDASDKGKRGIRILFNGKHYFYEYYS